MGYKQVKLLGFIVGDQKLTTDPEKVAAVRKLRPPETVK